MCDEISKSAIPAKEFRTFRLQRAATFQSIVFYKTEKEMPTMLIA